MSICVSVHLCSDDSLYTLSTCWTVAASCYCCQWPKAPDSDTLLCQTCSLVSRQFRKGVVQLLIMLLRHQCWAPKPDMFGCLFYLSTMLTPVSPLLPIIISSHLWKACVWNGNKQARLGLSLRAQVPRKIKFLGC